jgi:hypothetical protein
MNNHVDNKNKNTTMNWLLPAVFSRSRIICFGSDFAKSSNSLTDSVMNPDHFYMDPDPTFHFDTDPDRTCSL